MSIDTSKSEIVSFFKDKNVFITGASGFLGRLLVEKLLRVCEVKKLYILVRTKKGTSPRERLQSIFQVQVMDKLRSLKPDFMDSIELIEGDCSLPDLGIKAEARAILTEKINVVFHGAATVNFEEPLKKATAINVCGTKDVAKLCHEMKHLTAFVHVSTAFCHCPRREIKEMFYDAPLTCDNLMKLTEALNDEQLAKISPTIMAEWPNTYAFTKAIAEDAIKTYATGLPVSVFRPAIVVSTLRDPIEGWIDNLYGPSGIIAGCGAGLIRVVRVDPNVRSELVPADLCVNGLMAAAYKTSLLGPTNDIPIFNFTPSKENPQTFAEFYQRTLKVGNVMPPTQAIWYLTLTEIASPFWYIIFSFFIHTLPAFLIDAVLVILQKKPKALKIYRKIHKFLEVLAYFATQQWDFQSTNLQALLNGLNTTDRKLFDFDMKKLDWDEMAYANSRGIRKFIMKEDESNIPAGIRKMFYLHILHRVVQLIAFSLVVWLTVSVLSPALLTLIQ
uniref:Fatty acyl-CoA reductase n=1 Tax=Lygus hesperus TaxID=30085 RepID=A0A146LDG8_LYGHE